MDAALLGSVSIAAAQGLPQVPRERTLISRGWHSHNQVPLVENFNPYAGVLLHQRSKLHSTVYEALFCTHHMTNELIPWIAEGMEYNADVTQITVRLRDGVTWSDGVPFTSADVVFTFDMLKASRPGMLFSTVIAEWVASATAPDAQTVIITLTKRGPRRGADFLASGQAGRLVVVPGHIREGQTATEFANFDIAKGWPVGTGPCKLVDSSPSAVVFDRRDGWWALDAGLVPRMPAPERIVVVPATHGAMPQLYASGQVDMGRSIQAGAYDAIRFQNRNLVSRNAEGPGWGTPDGCVCAPRVTTQAAPMNHRAVRRAISHALDRDRIVSIA